MSGSVSADADCEHLREQQPRSVRMLVRVATAEGNVLSRTFPRGVEVGFGREDRCHVVLPSPFVSRRHVAVRLEESGFWVRDSSHLGTKVDGELLQGTSSTHEQKELSLRIGPYEVNLLVLSKLHQSSELRRRVHGELLSRLKLEKRPLGGQVTSAFRSEVRDCLSAIVRDPQFGLDSQDQRRLVVELSDEALGLGPLEALLADHQVSEIMVVDPGTIYAERAGKLELTGRMFTDAEAVRSAIERIVSPVGRRIDESSPLVDARLPDGSRVNAIIPPLALRGPCITIRKFPKNRLSMQQLVGLGSLSERMARFMTRSVFLRKNIVISGGTGSGKTTLLNVLSSAIEPSERLVTIEDAAELALAQPHVVGLESKPPNLEGQGEIKIRDLLKNALRMRPDRIIVGECRGGEALDMLQAMNTGHDGSMTTTHANSPEQAIARLETLCLMGGLDLPLAAIRRQVADSVDLVIQQSRLTDGSRKVTNISEVVGLNDDGKVELRPLFALEYRVEQAAWTHVATGYMPTYLPELDRVFGEAEGEVY